MEFSAEGVSETVRIYLRGLALTRSPLVPAEVDRFVRTIEIRNTTSFWSEAKQSRGLPVVHVYLRHVKENFTHDKGWMKGKLDAIFGHPHNSPTLILQKPLQRPLEDQSGNYLKSLNQTEIRWQLDNVTRPSVGTENVLQISRPVNVRSKNQPTTNQS